MFHRSCALCAAPAAAAVNLGPLLGPIRDSKSNTADDLFVHRICAVWSPEVYETDHGTLRCVLAAIKRGRQVKCSHCGRRGATVGCRVASCNCSFHVACAREAGCTYYCEQFLVACRDHAPQFKEQARQQQRRTPFTPYRNGTEPAQERGGMGGQGSGAPGEGAGGDAGEGQTPGGATAGGRADLVSPPSELPTFMRRKRGRQGEAAKQHLVQARAAMKRARKEMADKRSRGREAESSDDDEHFQKKEGQRLERDTAKLNPITLMGDGTAVQHVFVKPPGPQAGGSSKGQGRPGSLQSREQQQPTVETAVVGSIAATDFSSVAGLDSVVRQLREMVLLPMQYPELFEGMGLQPPRGILFHGVPGTGKTLMARALAGACAKHSPLPVTFFARKGADCLGKFHGEAERTLRLLFEEASRRAPAIIFLDELDALVPARAARAGCGDQIYASVVSTLLSLMDGLTDRGSVIVIGATNRPEAIDPALRRPGRFDREVYFGLPTPAQRLAILRVHTQRWGRPPPPELLQQVAFRAEGFAGADLQALCTAAVMAAVRRSAPLLLEQAEQEAEAAAAVSSSPQGQQQGQQQSEAQKEEQQRRRQQLLDGIEVQASDWREALAAAPPPCSRRNGMAALAAEAAAPLQQHALPQLAQPLARVLAALDAADLPLPPPAAAAASVAAAAQGSEQQQAAIEALEAVLLQHGALLAPAGGPASAAAASVPAHAIPQDQDSGEGGNEEQQLERLGRTYPPCRLLLWGEGEQGQEAAAGAVLKLLEGCPVHCLSLPSLVAEGGDNSTAGCVALVGEALRRADGRAPCVVYLPRLESWALSQMREDAEELAEGAFRLPGGGGSSGAGEDMQPGFEIQSPSFSLKANSPQGSSPAHGGGFQVSPSPFSGLLPLEGRTGRTPAMLRALRSVTQAHRQQDSAGTGSGGDGGPAMQQQASAAEPSTAGRPPRPPPAGGGAVLAAPIGLPPIRTSTSPEQQQQQLLARRRGEAAGGLLRRERDGSKDGEGGEGSGGEEGEDGAEVEVVCLSQAWNVFDSLMRQVPASQPIIVLATCHAAPEATPASLVQFFAGPAAAQAGHQQPPQPQQGRLAELLLGDAALDAAAVAAPGIVRMQQPSSAAWQQAVAAAADHVAASVASQTALLLHQQLVAGAAGEQVAGAAAGSPADASPVELPAATAAPAQQEQRAQQKQQQQQEQECNTAEVEQGLRLYEQLLSFQQSLGRSMANKGVAELDYWVRARGGGGGRRRSGGAATGGLLSYSQIAERCQQGAYDSLEALQADAAATAAHILSAAEEQQRQALAQQQRRRQQQAPPSPDPWHEASLAMNDTCCMQDEIETACFAMQRHLQLADPANARLLAAAAAHVRRLQRQKQEEQQAAQRQKQKQQGEQQEQQEQDEGQAGAGEEPAAAEAGQEQEQQAEVAATAEQLEEEEAEPQPAVGMEVETPMFDAADPVQQGQQEPDAVALAAERQKQRLRRCAHTAQLLRQQLCRLLRPALLHRLPQALAAHASAWQELQEHAGHLSAAAAAACRGVVEASGEGLGEVDGMAEQFAEALALRCAVAFAPA